MPDTADKKSAPRAPRRRARASAAGGRAAAGAERAGSGSGGRGAADPGNGLGPEEAGAEGADPTHDRLGHALTELLENPLVTGAVSRALGAREKAAQAQELWMGALNLPSAADMERLTRRLRSVSQRLEGVEDGVQHLGRSLVQGMGIEQRLIAIDGRLAAIEEDLTALRARLEAGAPGGDKGR
ncbi:MAG: hypothetical protein KGJ43_07360 [Acidobacteriota bacterium]|nr:hypothetical protein [Acidobacteriota bacterium]